MLRCCLAPAQSGMAQAGGGGLVPPDLSKFPALYECWVVERSQQPPRMAHQC